MIPLFITVTEFMSGEKRMINFQYIRQITRFREGDGSVLYFSEGTKLLVNETLKELATTIRKETIDLNYECWTRASSGEELL
jgi:hypothetical protein